MYDESDVENEGDDAEQVGVVGTTLRPLKEDEHPVDAEETVDTNYDPSRANARDDVEKVEGEERENIDDKVVRLDVVEHQFSHVCDEYSVLQVT